MMYIIINMVLVGGFNHLEKYEFVNGKDDIPYIYVYIYIYMKWKIINSCLKPPSKSIWYI